MTIPINQKIRDNVAAALFIAAVVLIYKTGLFNAVYVKSMCRNINIPVFLWVAAAIYGIAVRLALKKIVALGVAASLYVPLFDLVMLLLKDHSFLSWYYLLYIELVLAAATLTVIFYLIPYLAGSRIAAGFTDRLKHLVRPVLRSDRNFIIAIFLVSLIFRAAFAVNLVHKTETGGVHDFIVASDDGDTYDRVAMEAVKAGDIRGNIKIWGAYWDEGYSIFLAVIYKIFGRNFYIITMTQSFIGSFLPVLVFIMGKLLFSRSVGMLAAIAMALRTPLVFLSVVLGHESLWLPLILLCLVMLSYEYKSGPNRYARCIIAGVALGLVCVLRGLYLYFLPFSCLWILLSWRHKSLLRRLAAIAVIVIATLFTLSVFSVTFNSPISGGSKERIATLWGLQRNSINHFKEVGNNRLIDLGINFAGDIKGSIKNITSNPANVVAVAMEIYPKRILGYLEFYQFGFFDPVYLVNSARCPNSFMPTLEFYFSLFFVTGFLLCMKNRFIPASPVFMILTYNILMYAVIFYYMAPRHRDASTPFIYMIGAYGLVMILKRLNAMRNEK